ncbi:probable 2-oxoglutarate-dependent dioxygenase AOP1 [Pyrus x bretschneideri]|uniref:probable 2-oxoglutarate-dependent dioxygenase AOP1 n=1 Tax=Pyrus x bretschneideri TaxID=225117 RepID=UPI000510CB68|nr:probable 2-oxoglutarate-dependent dioxygenase AOP1 [Pyrus x bretschneideri]
MGSETQPKLPVIDLSDENLKPDTDAWLLACKEIKDALEEYGCFEAIYHKVPLELHNSIFSAMEDLFGLPLETKMQKTSDRPYHSYIGQYSFLPLYESLAVDNPTTVDGSQGFTNIMWPQGNDHFCETVHSISKLVAELSQMVTRMVFDVYGVQRLYNSHMESTTYQLRCLKYRTPEENETNMGLQPHTDKTFISIVNQNQVNGLQIRTKDGQWIDVNPSPSSFLILAGDAFMAWSNDRVPSCEHQIIMKENKTRYSLGLFSFKSGIIQVPEELIDEKHPLLYKPFDHFSFLDFGRTPEARNLLRTIKAYCGV